MKKKTIAITVAAVSLLTISGAFLFPKATPSASADKVKAEQIQKPEIKKTAQKILKEFPTLKVFQEQLNLNGSYLKNVINDNSVFIPDPNGGEQAGWSIFPDGKAGGKAIKDEYGIDEKTGGKFLMYRSSDAITYKEIKALYNK